MKVLFVELEMERNWSVASIGPAFLSSYVRPYGHECTIVHIPFDMSIEDATSLICDQEMEVLGLSLTTRQWQRAVSLLKNIRSRQNTPTIVGGLHPTFSPEDTLSKDGIDYLCLGEGEESFLAFLNKMEKEGIVLEGEIENIWVQGSSRPKVRPPIASLDAIPFVDRSLLNERYGVINMTTQRGCPFPCTYCAARMYNEMYGNAEYGRRRSIQNVLDELHHIKNTGLLSYVIFLDDTFTINHKWIRSFLTEYQKQLSIPFGIHARAETINQRMLVQLAQAGCKHITFGVESGSERLRYEVMHRKVRNTRLIDAFRWTKELGMLATANYIIGFPTETREDIEETIALHHQIDPDDFGYFVFYPYPGTPMYQYCIKNGLLPENHLELEANHRKSILLHDTLTPEDIEEYYQRFTQIRTDSYMKKYGGSFSQEGKESVEKAHQQTAKTG